MDFAGSMNVVLISTYELGHQPFGLASPAAWLRERGHRVACADLGLCSLPAQDVREADLVAFYLPMHTATRLAARVIGKVKELNPAAHLCGYGLYAPLNEAYLRRLGVQTILGGEFEAALAELAGVLGSGECAPQTAALIPLDRLRFLTPDRAGLPELSRYGKLRVNGERRLAGYTEASRGCKHLCRHCPIVPVYNGAFRVVQAGVVLEDVRRQVAAGAAHITFGDPDFFNGPTHAARLVEALHNEFPEVTYDATIKIEHLLKHRDLLPLLRQTGCLFVTSAVESVDDFVLKKLDKGHTRRDFMNVAEAFRSEGLSLAPTFIPFTPWTTRHGYADLLNVLLELDLVDNVAPVQLALRLLIPAGSRMLELPDVRELTQAFDEAALLYRWRHADPEIDDLAASIFRLVDERQKEGASRRQIFQQIWEHAAREPLPADFTVRSRAPLPQLEEAWYCCAEPTEDQLARV